MYKCHKYSNASFHAHKIQVLRIMRLVPDCASELLGSDDCAFAVAVASVAFGAEVRPTEKQPASALPTLDLEKWCVERYGRKDREIFAAQILSFVQVTRWEYVQ